MAEFRLNFRKVVHGFMRVEASSEKEAEEKFDDDEYDEFENESEYEFETWERQ